MALYISSIWHHHMEIQLSTINIVPNRNTASWHSLYNPLDVQGK